MAQLLLGNPLLDGLNAEQAAAVTHGAGPVLVIAAPGSGKTTVLTRRIAFLILGGVPPERILAVTFTRKAAAEMKERLIALLRDRHLVGRLTICTFNSLGLKLLDGRYERLGFPRKPHMLVDSLQRSLFDVIRREVDAEEISAGDLAGYITRAKSNLLDPTQVSRVSSDEAEVKKARLYALYEQRLRKQGLMDFDDQIALPVRLIERDPASRAELQGRFSHILVDEFQDTNRAQYLLTRLLAAPEDNVFAVGDDAQGIYGFRAADLDNLLGFERDYPRGRRILLETNYRSTPPIVAMANHLIRCNSRQIPKTIRAAAAGGEPVTRIQCADSFDEARAVVDQVKLLAQAGVKLDQIAVLYRTHAQSGLVIEALATERIPYSAKKSGHFFEHPAIQEVLGYLRLVAPSARGHAQETLALEQLFKRLGCTIDTLSLLRAAADKHHCSLFEAGERADQLPLPSLAQRGAVKHVVGMIKAWRADRRPVADVLLRILDDTQIRKSLERQKREEARQRLDVLATFHEQVNRWNLRTATEVFKMVEEHLEPRDKKSKRKEPAVQLLTIHAAKGLEWDAVFVVGLEEGTLPYQMAIEEGAITEERRLCYVAITRARRYLYLSYGRERIRFGHRRDAIPSRFLREMSGQQA
ncbi:MAG: UvrD-helicase domain-containing protein [Candidatus Sericytochromatia bacterium]|nr:UvrD-helicase domain-containing protein [Candidatus Tanganyikabacteria bacterium]